MDRNLDGIVAQKLRLVKANRNPWRESSDFGHCVQA